MFCPQCEGEYREGIEMCPTCEVALVADLSVLPSAAPAPRGDTMFPAAAERGELAMVELIGFVDEADARAARATLKAADVPSELVIRDAFGPGSSKGDEYWIRVAEDSKPAALAALGSTGPTKAEYQSASLYLSEDRCPSCGDLLPPDADCPHCAPG